MEPLAKTKLNSIEVLISKTLTDSNISHDKFGLVNNVLKEYIKIQEENQNSSSKISLLIKPYYLIV